MLSPVTRKNFIDLYNMYAVINLLIFRDVEMFKLYVIPSQEEVHDRAMREAGSRN